MPQFGKSGFYIEGIGHIRMLLKGSGTICEGNVWKAGTNFVRQPFVLLSTPVVYKEVLYPVPDTYVPKHLH